MSDFLSSLSSYVWGMPLLLSILFVNLYLLIKSRFTVFRFLPHSFTLLKKNNDDGGSGSLSHFQSFCNGMAATIGLGNIAGVAVAINQGGPGAIFWMWLAGLLGVNLKFFECALSLLYRKENQQGVFGGPMYVIKNACEKKYHFLAYFFAACGLIGTLSMFQVNQLTNFVHQQTNFDKIYIGLAICLLIFVVIRGGLKSLTRFSTLAVPLMSLIYIGMCIVIIVMKIDLIPGIFSQIFSEAFGVTALWGGASGIALKNIMIIGYKRATFSNEAGLGTEPMAHSDVKSEEPISEAYVAMLGPIFDTLVICTLSALVILVGINEQSELSNGIELMTMVISSILGNVGVLLLGLCIFLFSFSTMVGMANYNKKCWDFLFGEQKYNKLFIAYFILSLFIGSQTSLDDVVNLIDSAYGLMAIPNLFVTTLLAKKVIVGIKNYSYE